MLSPIASHRVRHRSSACFEEKKTEDGAFEPPVDASKAREQRPGSPKIPATAEVVLQRKFRFSKILQKDPIQAPLRSRYPLLLFWSVILARLLRRSTKTSSLSPNLNLKRKTLRCDLPQIEVMCAQLRPPVLHLHGEAALHRKSWSQSACMNRADFLKVYRPIFC